MKMEDQSLIRDLLGVAVVILVATAAVAVTILIRRRGQRMILDDDDMSTYRSFFKSIQTRLSW